MSSDIMHEFAAKEIRSLYSTYDGWKATQRGFGSGYDRIVLLERRNNGHRECVKVLVSFAKKVSSVQLDELNKPEQSCDGTLTRNSFAVMVPANADTSVVPSGIFVYTMKSFTFDGNELAWVKKPVRKEAAPPVAA